MKVGVAAVKGTFEGKVRLVEVDRVLGTEQCPKGNNREGVDPN